MTLHFLHIGKTGGTAIKRALRVADWPETPYGPLEVHRHHSSKLAEVPRGDFVFFCVRDPIARFFSGFYSRVRKGQPRYYFEWTAAERVAFEAFPTPQALAAALASRDTEQRQLAEFSMRSIRHLRRMSFYLGQPDDIKKRLDEVVFIGRQETLSADWPRLKNILDLPESLELPSDPERAHRADPSLDRTLDEPAMAALRDWYEPDRRLVDFCEKVRADRRWTDGL